MHSSLLYYMLVNLVLQVCMLDDKESGLYPSVMFVAMVVYFLQQKAKPVLPVLHEVCESMLCSLHVHTSVCLML